MEIVNAEHGVNNFTPKLASSKSCPSLPHVPGSCPQTRILDADQFVIPQQPLKGKEVSVIPTSDILPDLSDSDSDVSDSDSDTTIGYGSHVSFASSREKAIGTASLLLQLSKGPKPDDFIFCDECNDWQEDICLDHEIKSIDNEPNQVALPDAPGLPSCLTVAPSLVHEGSKGVYALEPIDKGCLFGPFEGGHVYDFPAVSIEKVDYLWEVKLFSGQSQYILRESVDTPSNWMYLVGICKESYQQNVMAIQYKGEIYYKSIRSISVGEELMVFRGSGVGLMKDVVSRQDLVMCERGDCSILTNQCIHCPFLYSDGKQLSSHMRSQRHKPVDDVKCRACDFVAETRSQLRAHASSKHRERPYKCIICPHHKGCVSSNGLKIHMEKRHVQKALGKPQKHVCSVCGKAFAMKHHWRNHELSHSDQPAFACKLCEAKYRTEVSLKNHLATVHDIGTKYEAPRRGCPKCSFTTPFKNALKQHVLTQHSKDKQRPAPKSKELFRCNFCDDVFTRQSAVPRHEWRRHAMEKAAINRDKDVSDSLNLNRSHQCTKCSKSFLKSCDLKYHLMRHTGQFPHTCSLCPKGYPTGAELRKHIARSHKDATKDNL